MLIALIASVAVLATPAFASAAPKTLTLTLTPTSIRADGGTSSTLATVAVKDGTNTGVPGETVRLTSTDSGQIATPITMTGDGAGNYSAQIRSSSTPGTATITATDSAASLSDTRPLTQFVPSTTSLTATPQSTVTNQAVTLIAIVTASGGTQTPAGSITFEDNGVAIPGCAAQPVTAEQQLVSQSTCQASFGAAAASHRLTAVFTSGVATIESSSGTDAITVSPSTTTTSLANPAPALTTGSSVTYTATVTTSQPGALVPSGSVAFLDAGHTISTCTSQRVTTAFGLQLATCTVTYTVAGTHSITASYSGDGNFSASTSSARNVTVQSPPVTIAGTIRSTMQWTFFYTRTYTLARVLVIDGAPVGATVSVTCAGGGCPFKSRVTLVRETRACVPTKRHKCSGPRPGVVDLLAAMRHHRLKPGARLVVTITRLNWVGKYYRFTVRSGRAPAVEIACLAPGGTTAGAGC